MATLADLDVEIKGDLTTAVNAIITAANNLEAALAAGQDPTPQINELKALATTIQAAVTADTVPAAAPPAAPPAA